MHALPERDPGSATAVPGLPHVPRQAGRWQGDAALTAVPEAAGAAGVGVSDEVLMDLLHEWAVTRDEPLLMLRATGDDPAAVVTWVNDSVSRSLGYRVDELIDRPAATLAITAWNGDEELDATSLEGVLRQRRGTQLRCRMLRRDGSFLPVVLTATPLSPVGDAFVWCVSWHDGSEDARATQSLRASEMKFRALADHVPIGIFSSDVGLRLDYVNDVFAEAYGLPPSELLGTGWLGRLHPDDVEAAVGGLASALSGEHVELSLRVVQPDGNVRWTLARVVPAPGSDGGAFVGSLEDVTERRELQRALEHQATHDSLTGLPNRSRLLERLEEELRRQPGAPLSVLFLDLDDFKLVNDSFGHDAGDALLLEVARRLCGSVREIDEVARFGGDEFVILARNATPESALEIAGRLLEALVKPVPFYELELQPTASVGIVCVDQDEHREARAVLRDADAAMYQAKAAGKNCSALFNATLRAETRSRLELVTELRDAVAAGNIDVYYQPITRLSDERCVAVEALARWTSPTSGVVPPARFIAIAEAHQLIGDIGSHVLRASLRQLASWREQLGEDAPEYVSVNVSMVELTQSRFCERVRHALDEVGLPGSALCLELTETVLMAESGLVVEEVRRLRDMGVRVAIDDFGTGYSSLAYLTRLPVTTLKVDQSFVAELGTGEGDSLVAAVVGIAQTLGLTVVAEGVETQAQADSLRALGCTQAQGYLFSRPVPPVELTALLDTTGRNAVDGDQDADIG